MKRDLDKRMRALEERASEVDQYFPRLAETVQRVALSLVIPDDVINEWIRRCELDPNETFCIPEQYLKEAELRIDEISRSYTGLCMKDFERLMKELGFSGRPRKGTN